MGNATLKRTSETDISKCLLSKMQTGDLDLAGFPVINVFEYSKEFVLEMVVPGFTQDQIMVKVVNRELKVFSMIRSLPENTRVGERVLHEEYIINSFYRSFILTEYIDVEYPDFLM